MALRENIVVSATNFLKDPKVQNAPLAKRIAFLESKGLSQEEINEAISRANGNSASSGAVNAAVPMAVGQAGPALPPNPYMTQVVPQRYYPGWKDIFIGTAIIGGLGYGAFKLIKKYLPGVLQIPSTKDLEDNNVELSKQLQTANEALQSSKIETESAMKLMESQGGKINSFMDSMNKTLSDLKDADQKRDEEIITIKKELENVKNMLPKIIEKSKETNDSILSDLQSEIKSLKSLLVNRISLSSPQPQSSINSGEKSSSDVTKPVENLATNVTATPVPVSTRFSFLNEKPSIPSWQLQTTTDDSSNSKDEDNE